MALRILMPMLNVSDIEESISHAGWDYRLFDHSGQLEEFCRCSCFVDDEYRCVP